MADQGTQSAESNTGRMLLGSGLIGAGTVALSFDLLAITQSPPGRLGGWSLLTIALLICLFRLPMLTGGIAILRGRGYWLALAGGVASLMPTNFTMLLTVPIGIVTLVVLSRTTGRRWFASH